MINSELINNEKLKSFVSEDGTYLFPVAWEMHSTIRVKGAKNLADAIRIATEKIDELPLDMDADYTDGSYEIIAESEEEILTAQNYKDLSNIEIDVN